ncbi:TlpA disulfide reductase family protein [Aquimarina muelleri]|uniref:TlpA disulfide reductase family protein n=1 Tax=Aquimarina muelleri TaxID=279356 RepID=UPI003F682961
MVFLKKLNFNLKIVEITTKKVIILLLALYGFTLFGQQKSSEKLEYVIIANSKIITQEQLGEYGKQGLIKGMNKGVTQEERDELAEKFGQKIGDREFIIKIDLYTEKEKTEHPKQIKPDNKKKDITNELKLNINDYASEFSVEMVDGKTITLSDLKGKVVLVNYWATWCAPCLIEFTEIPEKILESFEGKDFVFVPISIGESKEEVEKKMAKMKKYNVNFNVGIDPLKKIWDQYATGAIPKSFIINQNGIIKYISIGNSKGNVSKLASEIRKLLTD